jgi:O-antigen/teichoic acid export membrane protein
MVLGLTSILGYKYGYIPFPSGSAAASFSVGISWICMWYLSLRSIREYAHGFDWAFFWKNTGIVALLTGLYSLIIQKQDLTL